MSVLEEATVREATIRVTEEAAATGKHSLKFSDAPGQKVSYNPHLWYEPRYLEGVMEGCFALRVEPGAVFMLRAT